MTTSDQPLSLPRLQAALPTYRKSLPYETYRRYRSGVYPKFVAWLVRHPALVHAFCADVNDLHQSPPPDSTQE